MRPRDWVRVGFSVELVWSFTGLLLYFPRWYCCLELKLNFRRSSGLRSLRPTPGRTPTDKTAGPASRKVIWKMCKKKNVSKKCQESLEANQNRSPKGFLLGTNTTNNCNRFFDVLQYANEKSVCSQRKEDNYWQTGKKKTQGEISTKYGKNC